MTVWFYLLLVILGLIQAMSLWVLNLKIIRFEFTARRLAFIVPWFLFGMLFYSNYFVKEEVYSFLMAVIISVALACAIVLAGVLLVGMIIILTVGTYWVVVTLRNTNYSVYKRRVRMDFSYAWNRIKAWIEGEE
ncbi:MAG: hypothetical protein J6Y53_01990 [Alphaproteobacteria bacterium]|nr:hypothetical protein [Alphaproteobacteria bacterium]